MLHHYWNLTNVYYTSITTHVSVTCKLFFLGFYHKTHRTWKWHKSSTYFELTFVTSSCLSSTKAREPGSQSFTKPVSWLLLCTTCCLAQPYVERRGGWERQQAKRWSVTRGFSVSFIRFSCLCLFYVAPRLWLQVPAEQWNEPGSELILTQSQVWTANKYSVW